MAGQEEIDLPFPEGLVGDPILAPKVTYWVSGTRSPLATKFFPARAELAYRVSGMSVMTSTLSLQRPGSEALCKCR